jgi:AAA domain
MKEQSYEPGKGPNKRTGNGYDKQQKFSLIPFDQITFDTRPAYLVKGVVPRTGLCVFWGPPKCGKSFLVFDLMMHIALGWFWHERRVQQGPVVYCAMEGQIGLKNRTEAFRQRKLTDYHGEVPFYLVADVLNLVADHAALIAATTKRQAVAKLTKGAKIALNALQDALGDCGAIPPASNHIPPGVKAITISQWRDYAIRRGISTSADARAKNMAFQRATECLVAAKAVAIWEPHAWPV